MQLRFDKYHGTGNDFIMIDNRSFVLEPEQLPVPALCDRHFGIGADGLIVLQSHPELDFHMIYFNSDGSQSFCGNGSRCAVLFAHKLGMIGADCQFLSTDGTHEARIRDGLVELKMHDLLQWDLESQYCFADTGSPHHIEFRHIPEPETFVQEARIIRNRPEYRERGVNVNFVKDDGDILLMRTYERGVEGETLSCGTGVTAVALMAHLRRGGEEGTFENNVKAPGGELSVRFTFENEQFRNVWLIGPAEHVFSGSLEL